MLVLGGECWGWVLGAGCWVLGAGCWGWGWALSPQLVLVCQGVGSQLGDTDRWVGCPVSEALDCDSDCCGYLSVCSHMTRRRRARSCN